MLTDHGLSSLPTENLLKHTSLMAITAREASHALLAAASLSSARIANSRCVVLLLFIFVDPGVEDFLLGPHVVLYLCKEVSKIITDHRFVVKRLLVVVFVVAIEQCFESSCTLLFFGLLASLSVELLLPNLLQPV